MKKRSGGGKRASAHTLQKAAVESTKRSGKGTKVSEGTIRRILGEQTKYKAEGTFFNTPDKTRRLPKRVREVDDFD
jgi:hypothetical protein